MIQCMNCLRVLPDTNIGDLCVCGVSTEEHCQDIACHKCGTPMSLKDGCEWPDQQKLYCWSCAHERLDELGD